MKRETALRIYNLLFPLLFVLFLPRQLVKMVKRGNYRESFLQRFAYYDSLVKHRLSGKRPFWIHAVSVGEVLLAEKVIAEMQRQLPDISIVLSTTTSTGYAISKEKFEHRNVEIIYHPIDFFAIVRQAMDVINPCQLILVEAEVWPNLVNEAKKRGISVSLINARLSERSEKRFFQFRKFVQPIFALLDMVMVTDKEEVWRWQKLGIPREKIFHVGSIKFDYAGFQKNEARIRVFRHLLARKKKEEAPLLLGASTHGGEERLLGEVYVELKKEFPHLFLAVAPRHVERREEVMEDLRSLGLHPCLRSQIEGEKLTESVNSCLVIDTTGELKDWYFLANYVVIGKSFLKGEGQNPVEAIVAEKPVFVGPGMANFKSIMHRLLQCRGIVQVSGREELVNELRNFLKDEEKGVSMAWEGKKALAVHLGATQKTVAHLLGEKSKG